MICTKCGKEIKKEQLFCSNCGYEIRLVAEYDATEDLYVKPSIDFIDENTTDNNAKNASKKAGSKEMSKKKLLIIGTTAAVALGISVYIFFDFKNNNSYNYQLRLADKYYNQGRYEQSIECAKKAAKLNCEEPEVRLLLARLYEKKNDVELSISEYDEAIKIDPNNEKIYENLFEMLKKYKKYLKIIEYIDKSPIKEKLTLKHSELFPSKPVASISPGIYNKGIKLAFKTEPNSEIYYTINAGTPTVNSSKYKEPIVLDKEDDFIVKAVSVNKCGVISEVFVGDYTISYPVPNPPIVTPGTGNYEKDTLIKVVVDEECTAYYNWDGKIPDSKSKQYDLPIKMKEGSHTFTVVSINKYGKVSSPTFRSFDVFPEMEGTDDNFEMDN